MHKLCLFFLPLSQIDTDAEGLDHLDASPTTEELTPNLNQENKEEIDAPSSDVPQTSMPADQDIQSRIDKTAVLPNNVTKTDMHASRSGSLVENQDNELSIDTTAVVPTDVWDIVLQLLQGLKLENEIKEEEVVVTVWDFAGQHVYYASHSVFLSMRAIYVLVHNLSKDLSAQAEPCARQGTVDIALENPTNQTNLDNLLSWLVSMHCIRPTTDEADNQTGNPLCLRPPVFIVGTHADEPFEDIMETEKCIKRSLLGKTYEQHVVRPFFAVDNTGSLSDYGVQSLQNKIMEVLKQEPYMGEKVPIRYGAINNQSLSQVTRPVDV